MKPFAQQNYYELLEVPVTAPMDDIRAAYARLMELYAPDSIAVYALVDSEQVDALRARMTEAMEILTDADLRAEYDKDLGLSARRLADAVASPPSVVERAAESLASAVADDGRVSAEMSSAPVDEAPSARDESSPSSEEGSATRKRTRGSASTSGAPESLLVTGPQDFRASFFTGFSLGYVTSSFQMSPVVGSAVDVSAAMSRAETAASASSADASHAKAGDETPAPTSGGMEQSDASEAASEPAARGMSAPAGETGARSIAPQAAPGSEVTTSSAPHLAQPAAQGSVAPEAAVVATASRTDSPHHVAPEAAAVAAASRTDSPHHVVPEATAVATASRPDSQHHVAPEAAAVATAPRPDSQHHVVPEVAPAATASQAVFHSQGAAVPASHSGGVQPVSPAVPPASASVPARPALHGDAPVPSEVSPAQSASEVEVAAPTAGVAPPPSVPQESAAPVSAATAQPAAQPIPQVVTAPPVVAPTPAESVMQREPVRPLSSELALTRPVSRPAGGRQLGEAQVLSQDSAIATAEAAMAQVASRVREVRPRIPDIPSDAEFNGELLRRVREARGYTLQQVADRTRISSRHLENVEADRYPALPAQVYLRGILMNLARELGLDPLRVSRSYLALASEKTGKK